LGVIVIPVLESLHAYYSQQPEDQEPADDGSSDSGSSSSSDEEQPHHKGMDAVVAEIQQEIATIEHRLYKLENKK
jgi:hypothetical protein